MTKHLLVFVLVSLLLSACGGGATATVIEDAATPTTSRTPQPTITSLPQKTSRPSVTIPPSSTPVPAIEAPDFLDPRPMRVSFQTSDGITLRGNFYPAARKNAPVVVMMHQHQGNQTLWHLEDSGFIAWLQNWPTRDGSPPTPSAIGMLPLLNPTLTFNVLTFDFRGHGESEGELPQDFSEFVVDARAAYQAARSLPHVDTERIVGIGASIGADAVVNACEEGCRGAFSISPGSYLGNEYGASVSLLLEQQKPVRCMYAVNDGPSPATCWSIAPGTYYKIFAYPGIKHGMTFFVPRKMESDFGKNVIEFLYEATK
jgi:pimeloyl-ACP methyl ester carboxylesterase